VKTTHCAKFYFDPTISVVSANTQFAIVTEKTISGVYVSPGSADTLVRTGGMLFVLVLWRVTGSPYNGCLSLMYPNFVIWSRVFQLGQADLQSLHFIFNRLCMKIFKTWTINVVKDCLSCFAIDLPSSVCKKGRISSYYDTILQWTGFFLQILQ